MDECLRRFFAVHQSKFMVRVNPLRCATPLRDSSSTAVHREEPMSLVFDPLSALRKKLRHGQPMASVHPFSTLKPICTPEPIASGVSSKKLVVSECLPLLFCRCCKNSHPNLDSNQTTRHSVRR